MKRTSSVAAAFVLLAGLVAQADATPILKLYDGSTSVTVADGSAADVASMNGAITWSGALGAWTLNVSTGLSKPVIGAADRPQLDLNSVDMSAGAGTLELALTDTGFTRDGLVRALAEIGGTTAGSVSYRTYYDASNTAFGMTNLLTSQGPFTSGPFSGAASTDFLASTLYSLTLVVDITHGQAGITSFDAATKVPEPSTIALLGVGLLALAFVCRRQSVV